MPSKLQLYSHLADQTARQLTGSLQAWTGFLTTAARLYKYPYHEQLMIYAQRPEATACADYELWNKTIMSGAEVRASRSSTPAGTVPGSNMGQHESPAAAERYPVH